MPGSLLLGNSTYSEGSDISSRSLGGKKVSFNKAVRVKQYPWRANPDSELSTLPNDRFWFKVYRNKEPFYSEALRENGNEDEYLNDSLEPISEADDRISDNTSLLLSRNGYHNNSVDNFRNDNHKRHLSPSRSQYVDSFDEKKAILNRDTTKTKLGTNINSFEPDPYHGRGTVLSNNNRYESELHHGKLKNIDENSTYSSPVSNNRFLPRINLKYDGLNRRSLRRSDYSQNGLNRERRSRSYDDYMDNDNRSECFGRADKSVSTEDLNFNNRIGLAKKSLSKDAATQYYDTLTRNKADSKNNIYSTTSFKSNFYDSLADRLKKFENPKSGVTPFRESNNMDNANQKNYALEKLSNVIPSRVEYKRKNDFSTQAVRNPKQYNSEPLDTWNSKPTLRTVNGKVNGLKKEANMDTIKPYPKMEESQYTRNKWNQSSSTKEQNGTGLYAKRHTPLREVNTNTDRDFWGRNANSTNNNYSNKDQKDHISSLYTRNYEPKKVETSNKYLPKRYLSPNNQERRSFKSNSHSSESYHSPRVEPTIDWSHSGFQLASKPKYTSASDSEYTVNKRQPLLMYIPGVSHHDRPAEEDDRLSHLSDLSRSDLYDGSQFSGFSSRNRMADDFRLRRSMREGKSKWLNWRKKS